MITTQEEYDRLPVGISFLWRDKLLKKQTPTPHVAPVTTPVITLLLIAIVIVLLVWKTTFFWLKPKAYPQREPVERHPQIHSDYGHYQLALKRWEGDRQVFEKSESDRLAALGAWASKGGPLTALAFLVGVVDYNLCRKQGWLWSWLGSWSRLFNLGGRGDDRRGTFSPLASSRALCAAGV